MSDVKIKVTSSDGHVHGEYNSFALATIHTGLQQLKHFEKIGCSDEPEELAWEIKLYEFILSQDNPEKAANDYASAREVMDKNGKFSRLRNKREVAKLLGWYL